MDSFSPSPSQYKGPKGILRHRCAQCSSTTSPKLLRCSGCRAVRYCNREHQSAHYPQHKSTCKAIKKARAKVAEEDHRIRNATPDFATPANAFETDVGHFWGFLNTRDYMRARHYLAWRHLLFLDTLDGVQEALEHLRDMLRLNRSDNMGLRNLVPAIMLRLDLDQECYDFVKWWATCDIDGNYDWGDMTLPYLNISGANVLEDPSILPDPHLEFDLIIALLMLKLKLLVDIRNLKVTRKILNGRSFPSELWEPIELAVIRSPLSVKFQKESYGSLLRTETTLLDHVRHLGERLTKANPMFMVALFSPDQELSATPDTYTAGSWEQVEFALQNSYAAWWEMEGVLELLKDARVCAIHESQELVDEMMKDKELMSGPASLWGRNELVVEVGTRRIWEFLPAAFGYSSHLGSLD
ncbi:hypothetical protein Plec18170_001358 [Paecilomyces lecythidis]